MAQNEGWEGYAEMKSSNRNSDDWIATRNWSKDYLKKNIVIKNEALKIIQIY